MQSSARKSDMIIGIKMFSFSKSFWWGCTLIPFYTIIIECFICNIRSLLLVSRGNTLDLMRKLIDHAANIFTTRLTMLSRDTPGVHDNFVPTIYCNSEQVFLEERAFSECMDILLIAAGRCQLYTMDMSTIGCSRTRISVVHSVVQHPCLWSELQNRWNLNCA